VPKNFVDSARSLLWSGVNNMPCSKFVQSRLQPMDRLTLSRSLFAFSRGYPDNAAAASRENPLSLEYYSVLCTDLGSSLFSRYSLQLLIQDSDQVRNNTWANAQRRERWLDRI